MTKGEHLEIIIALSMCAALAFISNKTVKSTILLLFMQSAVILAYFFVFHLAIKKVLAGRGREKFSLPVLLVFTLYYFTIKEPILPLFGLSLALGNVLAIYKNSQTFDLMNVVFASIVIAYFSCILATIGGILLDKIKLR